MVTYIGPIFAKNLSATFKLGQLLGQMVEKYPFNFIAWLSNQQNLICAWFLVFF